MKKDVFEGQISLDEIMAANEVKSSGIKAKTSKKEKKEKSPIYLQPMEKHISEASNLRL